MEKKYKVVTKVACTSSCNDKKCLNCSFKTWHVNDLLKFVDFLNREHQNWRWFNVNSIKNKTELANFTKNKLPTSKWIN